MDTRPSGSSTDLHDSLIKIARLPTASELWILGGTLLDLLDDHPDGPFIHGIVRDFYFYTSELQSKLSARQYNELASRLDVGAVGVLALQDIIQDREGFIRNAALGALGEGLMVLASRQYVKAWEQELKSVHRRAAWTLFEVLWRLSKRSQPQLPVTQRRSAIAATLTPVLDDDTPLESKILLVLRLFQAALLLLLAPLCIPQ